MILLRTGRRGPACFPNQAHPGHHHVLEWGGSSENEVTAKEAFSRISNVHASQNFRGRLLRKEAIRLRMTTELGPVSLKRPQIVPLETVPREDTISRRGQSSLRPCDVTSGRSRVHLFECAWAEEVPKVRVDPIQSYVKEQKRNMRKALERRVSSQGYFPVGSSVSRQSHGGKGPEFKRKNSFP